MRLTVVGCSGSYPGPESPASCYLVEHEHEGRTWRLVVDLGSGALGELHRHADPNAVDAVVLSHLHADHCLDLCGYYVARKYHPTGPQPRLPVYGPQETAQRMAKAYDLDEDPGMNQEFNFLPWPEEPTEPVVVGPFTVTARRVVHPVTAYALRIEAGGRVLAYSGDTGVCDALVEHARDSDLLLCEASFLDGEPNPPGVHLTGSEAAETATKAGVDRLLLTHVPPWHDRRTVVAQARAVYAGRLEVASTGAVFEV